MNINDIWDNNIPKEFWNISKYRATLGHKINHSFVKKNTKFGYNYHPRFGVCRTVVATKNIKKHEELWVDYGYDLDDEAPQWYLDTYKMEVGEIEPKDENA